MKAWGPINQILRPIPDMFKDSFQALPIRPDEFFPYTVLTPSYEGFMRTMRCTPKTGLSLITRFTSLKKVDRNLLPHVI